MEATLEYAQERGFRPPWWLRNAHVQSILPSLALRRALVRRRCAPVLGHSRPLILDCGEGVRLLAHHTPALMPNPTGAVVMLHGWEGDTNAMYMLALARRLLVSGFEILRLNLRDHGGTQALNPGLFHSCLLPEVIGAVQRAQELFSGLPLHLAGFSLGGNFLLRVAADAPQAGLRIASVVAISPVLEPRITLAAIESGLSLYHRYFVRKWSTSLRAKQRAWPKLYRFNDMGGFVSLRQMTAALVARHTQYRSLEEYLDGYSITGRRLAGLTVPSTIITAVDDPIVPVADITRLAASSQLRALVTPFGGHCGFLTGLTGDTWAENAVVARLTG
ncbi:MAG TPA: alpha/beta fold hydrolase [Steroidobacteraceae bacterium]|nr:alpha/beta fold hydrolase [Steroidobacteraceae bacterium]